MVLHQCPRRHRATQSIPSIRGTSTVRILAFGRQLIVWKPKILLTIIIHPAAARARTVRQVPLHRPRPQAVQRIIIKVALIPDFDDASIARCCPRMDSLSHVGK